MFPTGEMAYAQQTPHLAAEPRPDGGARHASHRQWQTDDVASMVARARAPAPPKASSALGGPTGNMVFDLRTLSGDGRKAQHCAGRSDGWLNWLKLCDTVSFKCLNISVT
jgi:hypothetical protein